MDTGIEQDPGNAQSYSTLIVALVLSGCATVPEPGSPPANFKTQIRWTSYGIPHVKADDWAGMDYGFAYATAPDGVCIIVHDVMTVKGNLSRFLGPENGHLQSDVFHRGLLTADRLVAFSAAQSANEHEFSKGYVAGYNRYLRDHADDLPAASIRGSNADMTSRCQQPKRILS